MFLFLKQNKNKESPLDFTSGKVNQSIFQTLTFKKKIK